MKYSRLVALLASSSTIIIAIIVIAFNQLVNNYSNTLSILLIISSILAAISLIVYFLQTVKEYSEPFRIFIFGEPGVGKTMFLVRLFEVFNSGYHSSTYFQPYFNETRDLVNENLDSLTRGIWPSPTSESSDFVFRALAEIPGRIRGQRYTLEINDLGLSYRNSSDLTRIREALHRSDALLLAIDGGKLVAREHKQSEKFLMEVLSHMGALTGTGLKNRSNFPMALLVLKSDLIPESHRNIEFVKNSLQDLVQHCETHFNKFHIFLVTAAGNKNDFQKIDEALAAGIVNPIEWILAPHLYNKKHM